MTEHQYYVALITNAQTKFVGPFKTRREAGNFNENKCKGRGHTYHYLAHRLRPFTGQVISPEDYLKEKKP